jgi:hypothetical protein
MGLQLTRRAPGWDGNIVGPTTVTLRLPIGLTYHQVYTEYVFNAGALALEDAVTEVRVVANGKPIWNILASELDTYNQFNGRSAAGTIAGGILVIDFDRFGLRMRSSEELTSLGSGMQGDPTPLTTLTIELDLLAAVTAGTLDSRLQQSEARPLGLFKKIRRYVNAFGGAGTFEIDDFPKGDLINAVFFNESANDIDRVRLERDDFVMFDRTTALNVRIQTDGVRVPQANQFVYDTTEKGNGVDQLLTRKPDGTLVNDLRWFIEIDGAMTIVSNVEYLGALEL